MFQSRSKFDEYKQVYRFTFSQPKIVYRINPDYEGPLASHGERVIEKLLSNPSVFFHSRLRYVIFFRKTEQKDFFWSLDLSFLTSFYKDHLYMVLSTLFDISSARSRSSTPRNPNILFPLPTLPNPIPPLPGPQLQHHTGPDSRATKLLSPLPPPQTQTTPPLPPIEKNTQKS